MHFDTLRLFFIQFFGLPLTFQKVAGSLSYLINTNAHWQVHYSVHSLSRQVARLSHRKCKHCRLQGKSRNMFERVYRGYCNGRVQLSYSNSQRFMMFCVTNLGLRETWIKIIVTIITYNARMFYVNYIQQRVHDRT